MVSQADNTSFKGKLDSVKMMIRKVQVNSVIEAAHAKALEMGTAKYPITQSECKTSVQAQEVMQKKICTQLKFQMYCHRFCQKQWHQWNMPNKPVPVKHFEWTKSH